MAAKFSFREQKIRIALRVHLSHGLKQVVARDAGMRPDQLSKCLGGENPIRVPEILVEVALLHLRGSCGHSALTEAIQMLRDGKVQDFTEHRCLADVVEYPGGRTRVEFE